MSRSFGVAAELEQAKKSVTLDKVFVVKYPRPFHHQHDTIRDCSFSFSFCTLASYASHQKRIVVTLELGIFSAWDIVLSPTRFSLLIIISTDFTTSPSCRDSNPCSS